MGSLITSVSRLVPAQLAESLFDTILPEGCWCHCFAGICDSIALATSGCFLTRMTPLASRAAMSLCLASLLTNYLLLECFDRLQNPVFRRRRTQRGVCRKRNQAARVKSLRDCPKQVRPGPKSGSDRHSIRDRPRCSDGCPGEGSRRLTGDELMQHRTAGRPRRDGSRES